MVVLFSALGGALTLGMYKLFIEKPQVVIKETTASHPATLQTNYSN